MKNKIVAFSAVALVIIGSAVLHVLPLVAVAMIAEGSETVRAFGTLALVASLVALAILHHLNGSFRSPITRKSFK
jgi:hypothetical protein